MATFNGVLGSNKIYAAMFNMIINQMTFSDNIASTSGKLADLCKESVGLYGDRKLFYSTDVLPLHDWEGDAEAAKLLQLDRAKAPKCQEIKVDTFKQIRLTTDRYLSKQAWMNSGSFSEFETVLVGWINESKRIYDSTTVNAYVGAGKADQTEYAEIPTLEGKEGAEKEVTLRLRAQAIATNISNILDDIEDIGRNYNGNGFMRSFARDDLVVVYSTAWKNEITKMDLPMIFHSEMAQPDKFNDYKLPARYFGDVAEIAGTTTTGIEMRALVGKEFETTGGDKVFVFAGEHLPADTKYLAGEVYKENPKVVARIMHKRSLPYMSAFEVSEDFYNPRSLTLNHYLTFGHNKLEQLKNYPFLTFAVDEV